VVIVPYFYLSNPKKQYIHLRLRGIRHEIMKSKALYLILIIFLLSIPVVNAEDALDWYAKGQYALSTKDYANALTYFNNALAIDSTYVSALSGKAVALNSLSDYADAVSAADQALALKPSDQNALNARAYGLFMLGRYAEAATAYDAFIEVQAGRPDAYCNQGYSYKMLNNSASALVSYDKCTAQDPGIVDGWNQKGLILMGLGRYQEALAAYDRATQITVKNAEVWNNKGLAFVALGKYQDALQCFNKALGLKPDFSEALKNKESIYGKSQVSNISATIPPAVTVSRTVTLSPAITSPSPPSQITSLPTTELGAPATTPVAANTTYAPVSPFTSLVALSGVCGFLIAANRIRK
jgi:tetratricopeptide (TPR) repeat protein